MATYWPHMATSGFSGITMAIGQMPWSLSTGTIIHLISLYMFLLLKHIKYKMIFIWDELHLPLFHNSHLKEFRKQEIFFINRFRNVIFHSLLFWKIFIHGLIFMRNLYCEYRNSGMKCVQLFSEIMIGILRFAFKVLEKVYQESLIRKN